MPLSADTAHEAVRRLHRLGGGPLVVRRAAARLLGRLDAKAAVTLLEEVIRLARDGDEEAVCVLPAFTQALEFDGEQIPHLVALRRVALLAEQRHAAGLFAWGKAAKELELDAAKRLDAKLFTQSLGHLKTQARLTRNPDQLARLATASEPTVMRNVLQNPRLTEDLVVRIAARRPARPEPLIEIWRSPRWSVRPAVRRALALNPYLPPEVAARIVPMLARADLAELLGDHGLPRQLREQAALLLGRPLEPTDLDEV